MTKSSTFHTAIKVDRLSFTILVPENKQEEANQKFFAFCQSDTLRRKGDKRAEKWDSTNKGRWQDYRFKGQFRDTHKSLSAKARIELQPIKKRIHVETGYIRVDFNPNKFRQRGINRLMKIVMQIAGITDYGTFLDSIRVTRIDIAIDIYGVHLNNLLARASKFRVAELHRNEVTGTLETIVIGKGKKRFNIYDKTAELLNKSKTKIKQSNGYTRCEIRLRPYIRLWEFFAINNLFSGLKFYRNELNPDDFDDEFMHVVQRDGLQAAYTNIRKRGKRRMQANLKQYEITLFDVEKVWSKKKLLQALVFLRLPKLRR